MGAVLRGRLSIAAGSAILGRMEPNLPLYALQRLEGCWLLRAPCEDPFEPAVYVVAVIGSREKAMEDVKDRIDKLAEALQRIVQWSEAYPLDVFPEPDFKKAAELLKAGGITLDAISASNMRHVVTSVGRIAKEALE
jgi:hypothetical protein